MGEYVAQINLTSTNEQDLINLQESYDSFEIDLDKGHIYYPEYLLNYLITGEVKELFPTNACFTIKDLRRAGNLSILTIQFLDFTSLEDINEFFERYNLCKDTDIRIYNVSTKNIKFINKEVVRNEQSAGKLIVSSICING